MANHAPPPEDPQAIARAEQIWGSFVKISKLGIGFTVVVLILLMVAFVNF